MEKIEYNGGDKEVDKLIQIMNNMENSKDDGTLEDNVDTSFEVSSDDLGNNVEEIINENDITEDENKEEGIELDDKEVEEVPETDIYKEKYYQEKKKRKSALADRQRLEEEINQLKGYLVDTVDTNTELYGQNLYKDLEDARNAKRAALINNDMELQLEADELYQNILYKINDFENRKKRLSSNDADTRRGSDYEHDYDSDESQDYEDQKKIAAAQEWLSDYPELIEDSPNYNPQLREHLWNKMSAMNRRLTINGRENEILSAPYLDKVSDIIENFKKEHKTNTYKTSNVGGVRNNFSSNGQGKIRVTLNEPERRLAKALGMSEAQFLKEKVNDIKQQRKGK